MKSDKTFSPKAPEDFFDEATRDRDLSSGDLRLLTSGLMALRKTVEKPLNKIELQAVAGLIAYVAYNQKVDETTVSEILTARYGVTDIQALPSRHYQNAVEFLVDLEMNKIVN